jgi:hypothetical protein
VLRADASIPTRPRSSRAPRVGASAAATASESSRGAAEASRPRLVTSSAAMQPAVAEARRAPAVVEVQQATAATESRPEAEVQPAVPVVVASPATSAVESRSAPAAGSSGRGAATGARGHGGAVGGGRGGAARAHPRQAMAVEIPDDDVPPPGWDQWVNLPMPAPEPHAGALVRWWDGHMVAGGRGHDAEASSSRAGPLLRERSALTSRPPTLSTPKRSSSCGRSSVITAPRSTEH